MNSEERKSYKFLVNYPWIINPRERGGVDEESFTIFGGAILTI